MFINLACVSAINWCTAILRPIWISGHHCIISIELSINAIDTVFFIDFQFCDLIFETFLPVFVCEFLLLACGVQLLEIVFKLVYHIIFERK